MVSGRDRPRQAGGGAIAGSRAPSSAAVRLTARPRRGDRAHWGDRTGVVAIGPTVREVDRQRRVRGRPAAVPSEPSPRSVVMRRAAAERGLDARGGRQDAI